MLFAAETSTQSAVESAVEKTPKLVQPSALDPLCERIAWLARFEWLPQQGTTAALVLALVCFVAVALWAVWRDRQFVFDAAPTPRRWRDLRLWAVAALAIQLVLYWRLG